MKIACPSCSAKYSIADEKVQNKLAKIRCRKCGATIVIDGKSDPPTIQTAGGSVHPGAAAVSHMPASQLPNSQTLGAGGVYTVDVGENDQRSMSVAEIVSAYNTGAITADTYVWQDGMADWAPLADVAEINSALHAAAASQSSTAQSAAAQFGAAQSAAAQSAAAQFGAAQFPTAQSAAVPAVAAAAPLFGSAAAEPVRAATRAAASADLFGGIDMAGSEHDATGDRGDAAVTTATTGARNESSVLFSLSALTASDGAKPGPGGKSTSEDSGLIDLAALTAAAERSDASQSMDLGAAPLRAAPIASPLGAAPLTGGTTSPLGDMGQPPPSGSKNGLFIGGGIAVAAVVAGLVFLLKEEPPPTPAVVPTATIVVTTVVPAPMPEATAAAADTKEEEQEAEEEKEKSSTTSPKRKYTAPKTTPKPTPKSGETKSETPKAAAPPAEKPKKSNCNCPKGDLMCAMKCSTK